MRNVYATIGDRVKTRNEQNQIQGTLILLTRCEQKRKRITAAVLAGFFNTSQHSRLLYCGRREEGKNQVCANLKLHYVYRSFNCIVKISWSAVFTSGGRKFQ